MTDPIAPAGGVDATEVDPAANAALDADLAAVRAAHPNRTVGVIRYKDRVMIAYRPTDGQMASLLRLAQSHRMEDTQRISNFLDVLLALLAEPEDRSWFEALMLDGEADMGGENDGEDEPASALGLLRAISIRFADGDVADTNRRDRRDAARRVR